MRSAALPHFSSKIPGFILYVILSSWKNWVSLCQAAPFYGTL